MKPQENPVLILMADDDEDDRMLTKEAFKESCLANELRFVEDGEALMDYLFRRGEYADPAESPRPGLILLDLNMPKKDGRECLKEIKSDSSLRRIPVVILTTSQAEEVDCRCYEAGANSYIAKPVSFEGLVETVAEIGKYWFKLVELPPTDAGE